VFLITIPYVVRLFVATVSKVLGWSRVSDLVGSAGRKTTTEVWALQAKKKEIIHQTIDLWKKLQLDAIICPSGVITAAPSGVAAELTPMCCYTALFNVLDMPSGVVPCTYVTKDDDFNLNKYQKNDPWDNKVHQAAGDSVGLPVAVQVAALPWEDEMCLHVMKELELAMDFKLSGGLVNAKA
jgi:fatty acid amide hydrolase